MSYNATLLTQCEDMQNRLEEAWGVNSLFPRDPIPFLEYILSPENVNLVDATVNPGEGKTMNVNMTYFQRYLESEVTDASERGCDVGDKKGNCVKQYTIDTTDLVQSGERISAADLERFCQNNDNYFAERIVAHFDAIDRRVATKTAEEAHLLLGKWSQDVQTAYTVTNDALEVATKDASTDDFKIGAIEQINQAALMSSFGGFLSFGGQALNEHARLHETGCCSNLGLEVLEIYNQYGFAFAYDRRLATALGSVVNGNLIMQPGALQLLMYTQTPWKENISVDFMSGYAAFSATTRAGVEVDVYIKDNCPGNVDINVFANTSLVGLPDDMFPTGDNFEGVNYVAEVTVDNS